MDAQSEPRIFPTASRARHSKLVAFPVGAELLSRALDGVPQHGALSCTFWAGTLQRDTGGEVLHVLSASYTKRARHHNDAGDAGSLGVFDPRWEIWVHAVPVAMKSEIRKALVEIGLPERIRPWLIAQATITGRTGNAAITLEFNRLDKVLVMSRRDNLLPDTA